MKKALIIVDVQKDFCPGGALPAALAPATIPVINKIAPQFDYVVASKDWHPEKTIHFDKWPVHCVADTDGAAFHAELKQDQIDLILYKGTGNKDDGYSAFEATNVELAGWFKDNKITDVFVCGLTTEYCVKSTALDAIHNGFNTSVIVDAIAPVAAAPEDEANALHDLENAGVKLLNSSALKDLDIQ